MKHRVIDLGASARDVTKIIFLLAHRQMNERLTTVHLAENIDAVILRAAYTTDAVFCTCHELACSHLSFSRKTHLRPSAVGSCQLLSSDRVEVQAFTVVRRYDHHYLRSYRSLIERELLSSVGAKDTGHTLARETCPT